MNHSLQVYLSYFYKTCYIPELLKINSFSIVLVHMGCEKSIEKIPPEFFLMAPSKTITYILYYLWNFPFTTYFLLFSEYNISCGL